jgi:hypothetical protein
MITKESQYPLDRYATVIDAHNFDSLNIDYDRVKLSKNFDLQVDKILLKEASWFEENFIEVMLETV